MNLKNSGKVLCIFDNFVLIGLLLISKKTGGGGGDHYYGLYLESGLYRDLLGEIGLKNFNKDYLMIDNGGRMNVQTHNKDLDGC